MKGATNEPIAIIGTGCRFPGGSNTASKLWELLKEPKDVSKEIPADRFNLDRFYHKDSSHHGTANVRRSYLLDEDVRLFDTQFFGISPGEAQAMDPQHRVLLEVVYEAIESAGQTIPGLQNSDTAVYVGLMCTDYYVIQAADLNSVPTYNATGVANSNASSRVSYFFNWHGPSMTIDTACSSSLVAVHEAVQALRNGTSRMAVACGTNLILSPLPFISESNLSMLSPTGRSRMWDADADGYARGEGVAAVVLKPLSAAIEDGDVIECIIREIGVNQDGKTRGITMPSAQAQASLIRQTYAKAGLDPSTQEGRCQFFEAHGTGTPAGDPQEAEALKTAFFPDHPDSSPYKEVSGPENLLVGSIKTVIGHTEGTAGLAGLLKACMALKHGIVPPNLLFNRLNPALEPFTNHLRIPTSTRPWPKLPPNVPRRASVNSFGFGGTNAHAILEAYQQAPQTQNGVSTTPSRLSLPVIPFVFSAATESSLRGVLESFLEYLNRFKDGDESLDLASLAYILSTKRTLLPQRVSITASTLEQLMEKVQSALGDSKSSTVGSTATASSQPAILGVFTGQGAQWATMGTKLMRSNQMAQAVIQDLDAVLATLPESHRPRWSLGRELLADKTSRITEAELSQPLCTAVQIMLVDLLKANGVRFKGVVGHSSGEIAAAYAAGFISSANAIKIAYYRGYFAKLSSGSSSTGKAGPVKGAMMAVGTTYEDAIELCQLEDFKGRISLAAHNAPNSVTLSGDLDAIEQAHFIFAEEEKKFARLLKVDTAYHSSHMQPCVSPYTEALQACGIASQQPAPDAPKWFSSVRAGEPMLDVDGLDCQYWVDNLLSPVLFHEAVKGCLTSSDVYNAILEIGPHSALKGPLGESILEITGGNLPYVSVLVRGKDDTESFSTALGFLWSQFGTQAVDLGAFQKRVSKETGFDVHNTMEDLPTYSWTHDKPLWAESRSTKLFRTMPGRFHDLLGIQTADGTAEEWRWQNILKTKELPWLSGHALQGQIVFPGTGYIALAMEASLQIAQGRPVSKIDLYDLEIRKAIAVNESATGTELLVTMTNVSSIDPNIKTITADFATFSTISRESGSMALNCCGKVCIFLQEDAVPTTGSDANGTEQFATRTPPVPGMAGIDVERFYSAMHHDLGYMYSGPFRGLSRLSRKLGSSEGSIRRPAFGDDSETTLIFHPGMLDNALQGLFAAYSAPGDGRLWSMRAPTACRRVSLVPSLCGRNMTEEVDFDCTLTDSRDDFITGDVEVYASGYAQRIIEIEGLSFSPFAAATEKDDRQLFQEQIWCVNEADGPLVLGDKFPTAEERSKAMDAERAAFFYLKKLHLSVPSDQRSQLPWYRQSLLDNAERLYELVCNGKHSYAPQSWSQDTEEDVYAMMNSYGPEDADFNLTRAVGENLPLPDVLKGETNILQYMTQNNYLDRYYTHAIGFGWLNLLISGVVGQIADKHPQMRFLEIGAGTGGATGAVLERIGQAYSSYTYTDISSGFFERAGAKFQDHAGKMLFKMLDIEKDPVTQGFAEHSYDIILAANVLHATKNLSETLQNTRRLLKPGGFLVLMEILGNDVMRIGLVMGGLPGWWVGKDDGRRWGPTITIDEWDSLLKGTGFAGVDTHTPMPDRVQMPGSVFVAQAIDDRISKLRDPLRYDALPSTESGDVEVAQNGHTTPHDKLKEKTHLAVVGGKSTSGGKLASAIIRLLGPFFAQIIHIPDIDSKEVLTKVPHDVNLHIVSLVECDLDGTFFHNISKSTWQNFQHLLDASPASLLWVVTNTRNGNPLGAIGTGLFRSLFYELPETKFQVLDLDEKATQAIDDSAALIAKLMQQLRLATEASSETISSALTPTTSEDGGHSMSDETASVKMLWTTEPELYLDDGRLYISRVRLQKQQNERYNSWRRPILRLTDSNDGMASSPSSSSLGRQSSLELQWTDEAYYNLKEINWFSQPPSTDSVTINVSCSLASCLRTPAGFFFVQVGTDVNTGEKKLCLSTKNRSVVTVHNSWTETLKQEHDVADGQYMSFIVADMIVQQIMYLLPPTGTVLLHEPDPGLASLLTRQLANNGRKAIFTTTRSDKSTNLLSKATWIALHPRSNNRLIKSALPSEVSLFIDCGQDEDAIHEGSHTKDHGLGLRLRDSLSRTCVKMALQDLTSRTASMAPQEATEEVVRLLNRITTFAAAQLNSVPDGAPLKVASLGEVVSRAKTRALAAAQGCSTGPFCLVNWHAENQVPVSVAPVWDRDDLFRPNRTYWMLGLTGDLGRSLAEFMISRGARHVVLSSRTPKPDDRWTERQQNIYGATVVYIAVDLTSLDSVQQAYKQISTTMPPLAGVANGALVLSDSSVAKMTIEQLQAVLRPKVDGTLHLESVLDASSGTEQQPLDWFIAFSSIVGTTGNLGQAAYSAANAFLKAWVSQRRSKCGQNAAVIDISRVLGVGYVERETQSNSGRLTREQTERLMHRTGTLAMSETDLHQLFAEAVISADHCSRSQSGLSVGARDAEIITGLAPISSEQSEDVFWARNPRFGMLVVDSNAAVGSDDQDQKGSERRQVPVKSQLAAASTLPELTSVLTSCIVTKLRASLFLSASDNFSETVPLVDQGVDSLVGVDIRSWCIKELEVDVPVLKILGGASVIDLADYVLESLPASLVKKTEVAETNGS
ncbi:hypothetical protein KAF25_000207 [Fusarium avenaceum]|uniref:Polyketide synthase n=1 Tax=Fusarium avenaceum TaxID=40199 RepID=A0A9P7GS97_9HYPO|nr:hypothetical protein KAF25_000207 [Fusarium avenaceum]